MNFLNSTDPNFHIAKLHGNETELWVRIGKLSLLNIIISILAGRFIGLFHGFENRIELASSNKN